jgi:uncharacterized protein DUF4399
MNQNKYLIKMKKVTYFFLAIAFATTAILSGCGSPKENPDNAQLSNADSAKSMPLKDANAVLENQQGVFFVNLKDGDKVTSPVIIQMGVNGMEVEPAGKLDEGKGHNHLIIDGGFTERGQVVPADASHIHFGKGQTSDTLQLSPGKHTLTLQFANGLHESYGKDWSKTISITVIK